MRRSSFIHIALVFLFVGIPAAHTTGGPRHVDEQSTKGGDPGPSGGEIQPPMIQYNFDAARPVHAPTSDSVFQYTYDASGNLQSKIDPLAGTTTTYEYTTFNKLRRVLKDNVTVAQYIYDVNDVRIAKLDGAGEVIERYIGEIEKTETEITRYYFLGSQRIAKQLNNESLFFLHQDHLGSNSVATHQNGNVSLNRTFYEFGAIKSEAGSPDEDHAYNDKRRDRDTNFHDYEARSYAAKSFRFVQPDTIIPDPQNPQSFNRYAYVNNNPLKYIDPTGHQAVPPAQSFDLGGYQLKNGSALDFVFEQAPWSGRNGKHYFNVRVMIDGKPMVGFDTFGRKLETKISFALSTDGKKLTDLVIPRGLPTRQGVATAAYDAIFERFATNVEEISVQYMDVSGDLMRKKGLPGVPGHWMKMRHGFQFANTVDHMEHVYSRSVRQELVERAGKEFAIASRRLVQASEVPLAMGGGIAVGAGIATWQFFEGIKQMRNGGSNIVHGAMTSFGATPIAGDAVDVGQVLGASLWGTVLLSTAGYDYAREKLFPYRSVLYEVPELN